MPVTSKERNRSVSVNDILAAAKKLSAEERQLLRLRLFGEEDLEALKKFELALKKRKKPIKKSDEEIVKLTKSIRQKNKVSAGKMLY